MSETEGQQHPLSTYLVIWTLLFILSGFSYGVDYFNFQGNLRWGLILLFMFLKAGFIVSIFMHMRWERLALISAILAPPIAIGVFIWFMAVEGDYTYMTREITYVTPEFVPQPPHH
jgi:cytochrome c oxidase subunit 4